MRRGRGENFSPSLARCIAFFFQLVRDIPPERVRGLLAAAWRPGAQEAITALKLAGNLRGVCVTSKECFYAPRSRSHGS